MLCGDKAEVEKKMKEFVKDFLKRGLVTFGFGPVIMAIVYIFLDCAGVNGALEFVELAKQILLVSVMVFVAGGISAVYQIERLPLPFAIFIQCAVLYVDYIVIYLINGWLENALIPIIVFTAIFIVGFAVVWGIVYFFTRKAAKKLNKKLNN
jgi:preprotein translocase subunit SecY